MRLAADRLRSVRYAVAHQMGHSKIETTKNIYAHLFASDRAEILDAMSQAVSRLYAYEKPGDEADEIGA